MRKVLESQIYTCSIIYNIFIHVRHILSPSQSLQVNIHSPILALC